MAFRHSAVDVAGGRGTGMMRITTATIAGMGRSACRVWDRAVERPVISVVLVAATIRIAVAVALNVLDIWSLAPDAGQYLAIAEAKAEGRLQGFWSGYGSSLYGTTRSFSGQLWILFELFGPYRLLGQLLAVFYGVLTAGLTAYLALRLLRPGFALLAGMIVAFLPSQIIFSSVSLRESLGWALLAAVAVICSWLGPRASRASIVIGVAGLAVLFCLLVELRIQTAVIVLWCMTVAVIAVRGHRLLRYGCAAVLFLMVPLLVGHSPGCVTYLTKATSRLGTVRTYMAMKAETVISENELFIPQTGVGDAAQAGVGDAAQENELLIPQTGVGDAAQAGVGDATAVLPGVDKDHHVLDRVEHPDPAGQQKFVIDYSGRAVTVNNELSASFEAFPRGLLAVALRPAPWETSRSGMLQFVGLESVIWLLLWVFATAGAWVRRGDTHLVVFPVSLVISLTLVAAVTQGNLGTAFRHREQILFALSLLAAAGLQATIDHRHKGDDQTRRQS